VRKKIAAAVAAAVLVISGVALAGPALATTAPSIQSSDASRGTGHVDRLKQALAGLVTDGTLTQAQADKVATTLAAADPGRRGPHGGPGRDLATAATALGMTEAELRTALEGGSTLAKVAESKGVPVDTLVTALVDAEKAHIAQEVTGGRLTQAQADKRIADLTQRVTDRVNSTRPPHPEHGGRGPGN